LLIIVETEVKMRTKLACGVVAALVIGLSSLPAAACLRTSLDDRAVEWSTLIVLAKLTAIHDAQTIASITSRPAESAKSGSIEFQTYDFEVTSVVDGAAKIGDAIHVIRFMDGGSTAKNSICGQTFTPRTVGKLFFLLLRPEADLRWTDRDNGPDPRTPELHALGAYYVVHLELASDLGNEGIEDAKYTVTSTRAAEGQFKVDDARLQAQTLVNAQDDTEEGQAEHALLEMGPKAIDALKAYMSEVDDQGKARIQRVIRQLLPPSITTSLHAHG
jgi:hypothetical protein